MPAKLSNSNSTASANESGDHRTPANAISHLRNVQGTAIYYSVLNELRDMATGGDGGNGGNLSIREQYYPHFTDHDFSEVLRGLGESTHE